ncbi:MAG: Rieske 2Fe-2S domain-containing protein [Planctomycetes bacterium]|nr:Rieske 2Fe-2S domain-containing protein [Planctomycetota bacterium]
MSEETKPSGKPRAKEPEAAEPKPHVTDSRLGLRTGVPAVKKGTKEQMAIDPMAEGEKPFEAPDLASRREAMWMAAGWGLFGFATLTETAMLVSYLFPRAPFDPAQVFRIGPPEEYLPASVSEAFKKSNQVWICNQEYNGRQILYALSTVCTHLGCTPNWLEADQKFKCPCHGSGFYPNGINFEGPAPRPLERFKIFVGDDGSVVVDKTKKYQQEKGEWDDPDSYIAV